ncbi:MAG: hypothetical protein GWO41_07370 [candidate division Zixibacteria bacterium]|nr:hypothetical protein [candidate division Zixibacteria bacterium]NIR67577.1 hypothetical protein [candidate division Zixibacteria bacterium]NIS16144.1 hypothetical protein [candidate division Zixibacteria bacterium]NIS48838.1 hypothetical protein [candidate division Zixibacteria bacterium]NIT52547.1 hypothetical protein [candidate division Zixibacteria bacterium]
MFKFLRLGIILMSVLALAFLFACEGDQGPQGPEGEPGEPGDPGEDLTIAPPPDIYFSVAVFNEFDGTEINYRSQDFIQITFDTSQTPSEDLIVGAFVNQSPIIDGSDGDIDEWGVGEDLFESDIPLTGTIGNDNGIIEVSMRCVYDARYVYFFLRWSEESTGEFIESENRNLEEWRNQGVGTFDPLIIGSEDRAWLMFLTDPSYIPSGADCLLSCESPVLGMDMKIDAWDWRACLTDLTGYADDGNLMFSGSTLSGFAADAGGGAFMRNELAGLPEWMYYDDPNANGDYPFWFRFAVPFENTNWSTNSTVPGYMALLPYGDRADVEAAGMYENTVWTLELKRLRNTGSGNDIQF